MDVEDVTMESSISFLILSSIESNQRGEVLSPEEDAWVDSCLIKDTEISDGSWDSLKDALLEIVSSQPKLFNSSAAVGEGFPEGTDVEILPSWEQAETVQFQRRTDDVIPLVSQEEERDGDSIPVTLKKNSWALSFEGNPFLPTYTESLKESASIAPKLDLGSPACEMELSTEDIFRVWDLNIPAEDDELGKQLDKALVESSLESTPSAFNDSGVWKDLEENSLENIVACLADLSLTQYSS